MTETAIISRIPSYHGVELSVTTTEPENDTGIVFIHGILQAALSWKYQLGAPELSPWKTVAFDLRGHGFSSKPVGAKYYSDGASWSRDLSAVIDAAGLRKAILVGWSFGGRVILDFLTHNPSDARIAGLVFVDANTKTAPGHVSAECMDVLSATVSEDMATNIAARDTFVRMCFSSSPDDADLSEMLAYNNMTTPDVLKGMLGRPMDHDALMQGLGLPTLVIHGAEDRLSLPICGEHTAATIPGATLQLLDGVGHMPQVEARQRVNNLLAEFAAEALGAA